MKKRVARRPWTPRVVEPANRGERRVRAATLQNDWERGESFLKIARAEQAPVPGECGIEIIHEAL